MLSFIYNQLIFYLSIILILFLPGYFLLRTIETKRKYFSTLERFVISFALSIIITDIILLILGKFGIAINRITILISIILFAVLCYVSKFAYYNILRSRKATWSQRDFTSEQNIIKNDENQDFSFSKNQTILIILILSLTIFVKTIYLKNSIFPTSTDLGHHMFWSKQIAETGKLPIYKESDIVEVNGNYEISKPQNIADFIIGEHLIFASVALISGANFISSFPSIILFLINILSILAIFILVLRLFENDSGAKNIAILALLFIGPLWAISSSQAKFVSGGVIGNTIGNLLIPLSVYFLVRALREKSPLFMALAIFTVFGMAYTHHLSTLIFIFIFLFSLIIFAILNIKTIGNLSREWFHIILKPSVLIMFLVVGCMLLVYLPTYLNAKAINTAVGGPSKETRAGLTFTQLKLTAGEARMALGIFGLIILALSKKRKSYEFAFLGGWAVALLVMTLKPQWLFINLPSARIANYVAFPITILAAYLFIWVFGKSKTENGNYKINPKILYTLYLILFTFFIVGGFYDNSQSLKVAADSGKAVQTFHASNYLAQKTSESDKIVKDHNYITADSWIKLYFMKDYNYPFSRGYFKRYEDPTSPREMCTLWMISTPNLEQGQKCYNDLGVNFVMLNPLYDSAQFIKSKDFDQVYSSDEINIYYKPTTK